ncbi:transcriptional repressor general negative regulator of transcription subunit 4 [Ceratobasidium sp. 394]|nr:transcriptional repressor general negative regulator of transcription subunit 4 [Ceratobasidium sp. 394]
MSSRLPRSPHVPHSTVNGHSTSASHAKSHVLAGVQDAYWSDDEAENLECPLCLEEMDLSDLHFKPCPCGYQICNFCWHHIKENLNGRCPACRREYTEQPAEFKSVTAEEQKRLNAQKRKRDKERKELEALNRRHFANVRIVQRNLVYVTGLGSRFAKEELIPSLRSSEYFGQYGKVSKILLVKRAATLNRAADVGVYITYHRREDAARAIGAVDGSPSPGGGGEIMRASYGTTKYCMNFLRGVQCTNHSCLDLHEWGDERDCFTKEDLATLKHAMKDSETRQAPVAATRKRAEESDGAPTPPMGAALPRGASWGQNRGALPPAPAALSSSASSAFPAISATLGSANHSSRQARSAKTRGASAGIPASERPATPSRSRRSERNRDRSAKSTEAVLSSVSAVPPGLVASRPSTPGLSNPPSRPSTASKSPRDAFKSPTLGTAQAISLASVEEPSISKDATVAAGPSAEIKDNGAPTLAQSPPAPSQPAVPPPPPGLSLPPPPPGLAPVLQQTVSAQAAGLARPSGFDHTPSHPQYQMSGAAKALLDDVRARRESAPPVSTQQSPFPDFDRTLSNLSGGGFSFSFNMGSNNHSRDDGASVPYPTSAPVSQESALPARGVSGLFDPFRKNEPTSSLPPPPGLSAARDASGYSQSPLSNNTDSRAAYTGAFNPFADGVGTLNRSGSYDSERDAVERTSSRFEFARRQDSFGQSSVGYSASTTSSPKRMLEQLEHMSSAASTYTSDTSVSPAPAHWPYLHGSTADYGPPGISQQISLGPSPLQQQIYAPPGINHPHFSNGMELNAAGLKELLNIGGNGSNARLDPRRSQTDSFDARFGSQPFNDPAIMSVAPRDMLGAGQSMAQTMHAHLEPNSSGGLGLPQMAATAFRSPPTAPITATSPPPGFTQTSGRAQILRQVSQANSPAVAAHGIAMSESPALTNASIINSEPISPILSASDFPALPPPSTESQPKRETNQPFLQSRVTAADAKAAALAVKKAAGVISKKPTSKPATKSVTKPSTSASEDTATIPSSNPTVEAKPALKLGSTEPEPTLASASMKGTNSQTKIQAPTNATPGAPSKPGPVERASGATSAAPTRAKSHSISNANGTVVTKNTTPAAPPKAPTAVVESIQQVPVLSRKQKKSKPAPRPIVRVPKDEPGEPAPPSAPSSPVSTLLHFGDGSSPPTPQSAESSLPPEPPIIRMLVELASQYEIERLSFFDGQSYGSKLSTPLRYGPLVQALSTLSMGGSSVTKDMTPGTIDTAVSSFQQLLETLTQTISDLLRMLPRTTWDDTSAFDSVLKDMLKAEEFLEENAVDLSSCRDDDVTVLAQALEKRARWMEIQLVKLEELHRDINTAAVRSVLEQNDRGWSPRLQEPKGDSLAWFDQLGYIHESGVKRTMTIPEIEAALKQAKAWEQETEGALKDAMLSAY